VIPNEPSKEEFEQKGLLRMKSNFIFQGPLFLKDLLCNFSYTQILVRQGETATATLGRGIIPTPILLKDPSTEDSIPGLGENRKKTLVKEYLRLR
jgi:hypothetical protein